MSAKKKILGLVAIAIACATLGLALLSCRQYSQQLATEIATATSRLSTDWRNKEMEWQAFAELFREPRRTAETALQYHTGSKEFRDKGKAEDIRKAMHYRQMILDDYECKSH